jgi:ubiquitin-like 1-activating enzyme E1 B
VQGAKLLVVGAGGIGCELLKNLVLAGFRDIEVVDLDTIDISNLNRQFLFRRAHVDRSKAEVAAEAVRQFRPNARVVSHHGNVKDPKFGVEFVSRFDVVVNALDNLEARRHVNRLCLAAEKPLLEAGSTGHLGQVTVIKKGETECFECQAKPTQKVYPYCTIRSTPEKPVHCLVWAKNLYDLCFGPEDESNLLTDLAAEMKEITSQEKVDGEEVGKKIYSHLFDADIRKQAALEDLWSEKRPPPDPLPFDDAAQRSSSSSDAPPKDGTAVLDVQKVPSVAADARGFVAAVKAMYSEARRGLIGQSVFSKDDSVSMDFVHCAANLRMSNYRIGRLSRWDAQSIAGAIIPAVASTNAIVAGLEVVQLIHVLESTAQKKELRDGRCRTVWVRYPEPSRKKILQPSTLQPPNKECFVCGSRTARVALKGLSEWRICDFVKKCVQGAFGAVSPALYHNGVCIYSPEYPEANEDAEEEGMHPEWSLAEWGLASGALLQLEDEAQGFSCNLLVRDEPELSEEEFPAGFNVEAGADSMEKAAAEASDDKRKAEGAAEEPPAKRPATEGQAEANGMHVVELDD